MPQQRIPLVGNIITRGGKKNTDFSTYDQLFTNCVFEVVQNPVTGGASVSVDRRPGFWGSTGPIPNLSTVTKMHEWLNTGTSIYCYAGIQSGGSNTRVTAAGSTVQTHASSSPVSYFSETLDSSGTGSLVWQRENGEAWIYPNGGAAAQISAIPSGNVGPIVYMDGFAFIAVAAGAVIRNSQLNDPTAWPSSGAIVAQEQPDRLISLARHKNYIIAFGQNSTEFFVNAGNATGSPLQRVQSMATRIGAYSANTICYGMDRVFFLSHGGDVPFSVMSITQNGVERLSTPMIEAILAGIFTAFNRLSFFQMNGQNYLALIYNRVSDGMSSAFVYNFETKLWSHWETEMSGLRWDVMLLQLPDLPYDVRTVAENSAYIYSINTLTDNVKYYDGLTASPTAIQRIIRTATIDFGTTKRKTEAELVLVGDKAASTHNIAVSVSDDDYGTFSTARNVDMSSIRPRLMRNGSFRKRAYRLVDSNQSRSRLEALEVNIEVGAT